MRWTEKPFLTHRENPDEAKRPPFALAKHTHTHRKREREKGEVSVFPFTGKTFALNPLCRPGRENTAKPPATDPQLRSLRRETTRIIF